MRRRSRTPASRRSRILFECLPRHSAKARSRDSCGLRNWMSVRRTRSPNIIFRKSTPSFQINGGCTRMERSFRQPFPSQGSKGLKIPLVMTGVPADYRDPENQLLSDLLQDFATTRTCRPGALPRKAAFPDLISIIRCATVIVQPSMWEGWNTLVEDAKALGRPVICSDIEVHREQAPSALGYFSPEIPASWPRFCWIVFHIWTRGRACRSRSKGSRSPASVPDTLAMLYSDVLERSLSNNGKNTR